MSGDQLRSAAVKNNAELLRLLLAGGSNPCSVDDFGLNALHYAVWNGHTGERPGSERCRVTRESELSPRADSDAQTASSSCCSTRRATCRWKTRPSR